MTKRPKSGSNRTRLILLAALLVLCLIQFIPVDRSVPEISAASDFLAQTSAPASIAASLKAACYDCHSHATTYPSYSYIAPVSFWIQGHIKGGREKLNFSTWESLEPSKKSHKIEECIEEIEDGHMPPSSYKLAHSEAKLTAEQKAVLIDWLKSQG